MSSSVHRTISQESASSSPSPRSSSSHHLSSASASAGAISRKARSVGPDTTIDTPVQASLLIPGQNQTSRPNYREQLVRRFSGISDSGVNVNGSESSLIPSAAVLSRPTKTSPTLDVDFRRQSFSAPFFNRNLSGMSNPGGVTSPALGSDHEDGMLRK